MGLSDILKNEGKKEKTRGVGFSTNDTIEQMILDLLKVYQKERPDLNRSQLLRILVRNAHQEAGCTPP